VQAITGRSVSACTAHDALREAVTNAAERCDSLQSFFLMHSMGGGTGSGLGTYVLSQLGDDYPGKTCCNQQREE
jgi:cell division GTPase FtsZ